MMIRKLVPILVLGMVLWSVSMGAQAKGGCAIHLKPGSAWLATGTVTKVTGSTVFLLGKSGSIYGINSARAQIISYSGETARERPRVGDTVRVFGKVSKDCRVIATRIRLLKHGPGQRTSLGSGPQKEIKIIIEKATPPAETPQCVAEPEPIMQPVPVTPDWVGRGLIMDINYTGRQLKVRTSTRQFTINLERSRLLNGSKAIGLGVLNVGDAVRIVGNLAGLDEVNAQQVNVIRTRDETQNAVPQLPISVIGVILSVDTPSMTFGMRTGGPAIAVLADGNTMIQFQSKQKCFADLKPGMSIKMSGYGNLTSGYVAQHIQIIGTSP